MSFMDKVLSTYTCPRPQLLQSQGSKRRYSKSLQRPSITGICKRSRSIQIDADQIAGRSVRVDFDKHQTIEEHPADGAGRFFRSSSDASSITSDADVGPVSPGPLSPGLLSPEIRIDAAPPSFSHLRDPELHPQSSFHIQPAASGSFRLPKNDDHNQDLDEIIENLKDSDNMQEQADIIYYLYITKGIEFDTNMNGKSCTVKELLSELYEKACHYKQWWLVRQTAGMLRKRVEDLALAVTDLLVRQKQLSIGLPPDREKIIQGPLPPDEIASLIFDAAGEDASTASLTQEVLIYLAMFIRTEPKLFLEMLRLRTGLIIQVMASELARSLNCSGDEASDHLLNLSPFQMKSLLHHILSGKEFFLSCGGGVSDPRLSVVSKPAKEEVKDLAKRSRGKSIVSDSGFIVEAVRDEEVDAEVDRKGQWLRRRRLDGSLNRVPIGFYPRIWNVLQRSYGLSIKGYILQSSLTREMTAGEFKFALQVEMVLNYIPQPEYRQLMVEALMVLGLMADSDGGKFKVDYIIEVDQIVIQANALYLADQHMTPEAIQENMGPNGINLHFYDSAPSGRFGTMAYLCRALALVLRSPQGDADCVVS